MMELCSSEEHVSSWVMMMCGSLDVCEGQEAYWLVNFDMSSFDLERLLGLIRPSAMESRHQYHMLLGTRCVASSFCS